jgi:hypothetical protein
MEEKCRSGRMINNTYELIIREELA